MKRFGQQASRKTSRYRMCYFLSLLIGTVSTSFADRRLATDFWCEFYGWMHSKKLLDLVSIRRGCLRRFVLKADDGRLSRATNIPVTKLIY